MKSFFKELFEYSHYFNQKLWDSFTDNAGKTSDKSIKLYSHILNAHRVWNNRIEPKQTPFGVWEVHLIQDCKDIDKVNYEHSLFILDKYNLRTQLTIQPLIGKVLVTLFGTYYFKWLIIQPIIGDKLQLSLDKVDLSHF